MGMTVASSTQYENAVKKLFPRGDYWEKQFADPNSDCWRFCKVKADLIVNFRKRMSDLLNESEILTANETLEDWERVYLNKKNASIDNAQRRMLLDISITENITIAAIKEIGRIYEINITNIAFPFRPAFFGYSRFGIDRIASPAAFSVLFIYASQPNEEIRDEFEKKLIQKVLSNYIVHFIYGGS